MTTPFVSLQAQNDHEKGVGHNVQVLRLPARASKTHLNQMKFELVSNFINLRCGNLYDAYMSIIHPVTRKKQRAEFE
jgi:hypothetical protein